MNEETYRRLASEVAPKKHVLKNVVAAFLGGAFIALALQGTYDLFTKVLHVESTDALMYNAIIMIVLTMITTLFGIYKKGAQVLGAGLFIPTTGFANSVISEAIEYKTEGPIFGIGSRLFALAGSVIAYGVVGSVIYGIVLFILSLCGVKI